MISTQKYEYTLLMVMCKLIFSFYSVSSSHTPLLQMLVHEVSSWGVPVIADPSPYYFPPLCLDILFDRHDPGWAMEVQSAGFFPGDLQRRAPRSFGGVRREWWRGRGRGRYGEETTRRSIPAGSHDQVTHRHYGKGRKYYEHSCTGRRAAERPVQFVLVFDPWICCTHNGSLRYYEIRSFGFTRVQS